IHQAATLALAQAGLFKSTPEVELAIRGVLIAMAAEVLSPEDVDAIVDFPGDLEGGISVECAQAWLLAAKGAAGPLEAGYGTKQERNDTRAHSPSRI
ncbi:MAG: hypothetical protein HN348_27160, partial [Proteobacteria bacterium]|nr:hypothetical protein [Pseudomonadota bacterium]